MNLAMYGARGKRWAMTERDAAALSRTSSTLQIGTSGLHWDGTTLSANIEEITVPVPTRLRGTIRVHPTALATHEVALDGAGRHRWGPIAPGARVEVDFSHPGLRWQGTAYVDTNAGDEPLEDGFISWDWCRAPLPNNEMAVLYHGLRRSGAPFCTALRYHADATVEDVPPPPLARLQPGFWGVPRSTLADAGSTPRVIQVLEDAPFYTRSILQTRLLGQDVTAVHESLSLDRFVQPWVQVLLPFKAPRKTGRFL